MSTGSRWVCQYASASRSPPAFEAEYGFEGRRGSPSRDAPRSTEPYTSSVEMWTRRGILRSLTASNSVWTPKTSVRKNSSGSMSDRSTWSIARPEGGADRSVRGLARDLAHGQHALGMLRTDPATTENEARRRQLASP